MIYIIIYNYYTHNELRKPENVVSLLNVDPIELEFGYGIIPLADVNQGGDLLQRVVMSILHYIYGRIMMA